MAYHQLVAFDRPLSAATLAGAPGRPYSETELNAREHAAYRRGTDEARTVADRHLVELRADLASLSDGILRNLSGLEEMLLRQLRDQLPNLAVEIGRHLLAGFEPPADIVARICTETLDHLFPERENLELSVSARDAGLLDTIEPGWKSRYPGLRIVIDTTLSPGDCLVRSRFGLTDARQSTKLAALRQHLAPAVA
ncbi:MAG TPA: FliH/SctL family protein [Opitutus sp.]|nr:FliH/SctL family protein [Opitutus sp.]